MSSYSVEMLLINRHYYYYYYYYYYYIIIIIIVIITLMSRTAAALSGKIYSHGQVKKYHFNRFRSPKFKIGQSQKLFV